MTEIHVSYLFRQPIVCTAVFLTIIPIVLIFFRRAYIDRVFLILLTFLLIKLVLDLTMFHYAALKINNIFFENTSVIIRYCLLSSLFYLNLETPFFKRSIIVVMLTFVLFAIWEIMEINPDFSDFHNHRGFVYSSTIECILMIFWILLYFYETIRFLKIPSLLSYPFFWVCAGMLLYYCSIVFIAPFFYHTLKWEDWIDIGFLVYIPSIFESIYLIFFSIGIWFFSAKNYAK